MKSVRLEITSILIVIWLMGFLYALVVPLYFSDYIPNRFSDLMNRVIATYAPQLSIMLGFVFARRKTRKTGVSSGFRMTGLLAIAVSAIYLGIFSWLMLRFATKHLPAVELLSTMDLIQPKIGFLASGMLAYYFGSST